jgi:hypothetical protein
MGRALYGARLRRVRASGNQKGFRALARNLRAFDQFALM